MKLALLRHGRAADRLSWQQPDADRPLTDDGIQRCNELFPHYARFTSMDIIWTSPLLRAKQTATIASRIWQRPCTSEELLAIDQDPANCLEPLRNSTQESIMLVGHNPHLSELLALLSGWSEPSSPPWNLRKAGLALLSGLPQPGAMRIEGYFAPRHFLPMTQGRNKQAHVF